MGPAQRCGSPRRPWPDSRPWGRRAGHRGHLPKISVPFGAPSPKHPRGEGAWGPPRASQHLLVAPASAPSASKAVLWLRSGPGSGAAPGLSLVPSGRCRGSAVAGLAAGVSRELGAAWKESRTRLSAGGTGGHGARGCFCFPGGRCTWPARGAARRGATAGDKEKASRGRAEGGLGGGHESKPASPLPASSSWPGRLLPITQAAGVYPGSTTPPRLSCWERRQRAAGRPPRRQRWGRGFHTPSALAPCQSGFRSPENKHSRNKKGDLLLLARSGAVSGVCCSRPASPAAPGPAAGVVGAAPLLPGTPPGAQAVLLALLFALNKAAARRQRASRPRRGVIFTSGRGARTKHPRGAASTLSTVLPRGG